VVLSWLLSNTPNIDCLILLRNFHKHFKPNWACLTLSSIFISHS
jgi:hypothetical protein